MRTLAGRASRSCFRRLRMSVNERARLPISTPTPLSPCQCVPLQPQAGGKGREAELAKREAELNAREAELRRWEQDLRSSGRLVPKKNWPKCCPLTVMDIKAEVPEDLQNVVTCAYWSYLVSCFADATLCTRTVVLAHHNRAQENAP